MTGGGVPPTTSPDELSSLAGVSGGTAGWPEAGDGFVILVRDALDRTGSSVGVFLVDLPGLLEITEIYGDAAKQALLESIGWRLRRLLGFAPAARISGLRMLLLLQDTLEEDIPTIAERIQAAVAGPQHGVGVVIVGTPAVGVAMATLAPGSADIRSRTEAAAALIRQAELALQQAVRDRPGSYRVYNGAFDLALRDSTVLRQALLRAIERHEFGLVYQPVIDLQRNITTGLEALIRWDAGPGGASAGPEKFISVAEETGLIVPIGTQMLAMATSQIQAWGRRGWNPPRMAVNVSGQQLSDPGFLALLLCSLKDAGLHPRAIELELTERTLVDSSPNTIRMLEHLRSLGIGLAVDDFGTGYSSLRYLHDLPVSKLKIDRSFVGALVSGGREVALVDAVIGLARSLALEVVAEGIETVQQLAILRQKGCNGGQGYLFSPPLAAEAAAYSFDQSWIVS
jgi:EAL domain-containing protein (putative c-di-GMP-specific phosphodiesterase class I)/GGDEF domain-containing protein